MFTDPQVVTINAVAKSMPRIKTDGTSAVYQMYDESFKLTLSHQKSNNRIRSMGRIDQRAVVTDPLSSENDYDTLSFYVVIDRPEVGFSADQVKWLVAGFQNWLDVTTIGKLYGQES